MLFWSKIALRFVICPSVGHNFPKCSIYQGYGTRYMFLGELQARTRNMQPHELSKTLRKSLSLFHILAQQFLRQMFPLFFLDNCVKFEFLKHCKCGAKPNVLLKHRIYPLKAPACTLILMGTYGCAAEVPTKTFQNFGVWDVFANFEIARHVVDDNNHIRQGSIALDSDVWTTKNWAHRPFGSSLGTTEANVFLVFNHFVCIPESTPK